ncbi:M20/M25/M40 family metallo-hydrolase [Leucobacter luti]|uniref:M20/M25/M40 family metallo-hydrolase n=1 Tax=Leucobacter luti TaxID=340320 RepID=UPI003D07949C
MTRRDLAVMDAEAVAFARDLIRIDSTNSGNPATIGDGETRCAELVRGWLAEGPGGPEGPAGHAGSWFERRPGRGNLVIRIPGTEPDLPALLCHAHTDVVPADPAQWSFDPFGGEIIDGELCGRGAVDMKNTAGMLVAAVRQLGREGWRPRRDVVLAFVADEEVAGEDGMAFLVEQHPEVFAGVSEAIGELGGFSVEGPWGREYTICIGEKGVAWATLRATGAEGHGSMIPNRENAAARLVAALARITAHEWPIELGEAALTVRRALEERLGREIDLADAARELAPLGSVAGLFSTAFATTSALTQVHAGSKTNTVPGEATATVDCRIAPGGDAEFMRVFAELVGPDIEVTWEIGPSVSAPFDAPLVADMTAAIAAVDPGTTILPYMTSAATDAKALVPLGIRCYGFSPLRLPRGYDFPGMFHGIDERVPVTALHAGARILREFFLRQ